MLQPVLQQKGKLKQQKITTTFNIEGLTANSLWKSRKLSTDRNQLNYEAENQPCQNEWYGEAKISKLWKIKKYFI